MTEQEAKELIKYINEEYFYYDKEGEFDEINEALDMAISALKELREAREKQVPKKPDLWGDGYGDNGEIIYDMYDCPNCGKSYETDYEKYDYCPNCGQRLDWSESDGKK